MTDPETRLTLIRHGQTDANTSGTVSGSTDDPLNETGHEQAKNLAEHLAALSDFQPSAMYTSPLSRARDTSGYIAQALNLAPQVHAPLIEWDAGAWEGVAFNEIAQQKDYDPGSFKTPEYRPPQGESLGEVQVRITGALHEIAGKHRGQHIIIVSHGTALALALAQIINNDFGEWTRYRLDNCSTSELILGADPRLVYVNQIEHL
jgi:broad specificity phosphatase PhoE